MKAPFVAPTRTSSVGSTASDVTGPAPAPAAIANPAAAAIAIVHKWSIRRFVFICPGITRGGAEPPLEILELAEEFITALTRGGAWPPLAIRVSERHRSERNGGLVLARGDLRDRPEREVQRPGVAARGRDRGRIMTDVEVGTARRDRRRRRRRSVRPAGQVKHLREDNSP